VLTEAFGCNRCQRIFVLQADGGSIEELATNYPDRRRYGWNGSRWQILRPLPTNVFWALLTFGGIFRPRDGWLLWLQSLGLVVLLLPFFPLYRRLAAASPIFNLGLAITVAITVLVITMLWVFNQS
jgi:hypothetical protein